MTDPAPSPSAGQPPVPNRPMPRLGKGVRWNAHLDSPLPPTEPYQPKPRTRPAAGWPKTGNVGASTQLGDDEQPTVVPARPYAGHDRPLVSDEAFVPCRFDDETCVGQVTANRLCDIHRAGPPAAELRAMADDLNAHGGLDETFVAELLREAAAEPVTVKARVVPFGEPFRPLADVADNRTPEHQHVYGGSPLRCVECRRYLRPWWRRALDRVRRVR